MYDAKFYEKDMDKGNEKIPPMWLLFGWWMMDWVVVILLFVTYFIFTDSKNGATIFEWLVWHFDG